MLRHEAWILIAVLYPLIAFAYFWPPDWRNQETVHVLLAWTAFMVRTFLFHAGLLILAIAVVCALFRSRRLLLACLPLLLVTLGPLVLDYRPRRLVEPAGQPITVMSVNLLMINEDLSPIVDEILAHQPDVLLLQEYTDHGHETLRQCIGTLYPHHAAITRDDSFGAAIYSRFPFAEPVEQSLPLGSGDVPQFRAVIDIDGEPVAFYNIHLLPPRTLEYVIEQRQQWADLLDLLARESLPAIVAGDFNFTERSPQAASLVRTGLNSAHDIGGWGRGSTWPVNGALRWLPGLRLDHIFLSADLTCTNCTTGIGRGSDHRPVIARIGLHRKTP